MEPTVPRQNQQQTDSKNKKFIMRKLCAHTISQQNTKLATAIVKMSTISDVRRWNQLKQDGTSKELAQSIRMSE